MSLYQRPIPTFWWLERRSYLLFVLRELSSVFVAWFVVYLLLLINAISGGSTEYEQFLDRSGHWWVVAINVIALLFVLLHTVTWFGLAPKAMVIQLRGRRVPAAQVVVGHYLLWVVLSAVVAWVVLR
ncbi:fumarate reductase subunit C [Kribbella sancticallisti]|uniref:Fumarate reductase subunit C n=1 Tax=Kribbella sancticallisti TaxID=460087 RepID=A0ABP4PNL3_9ACTN